MAGPHQIGACVLAGPHQITGALVGHRGHRHRHQFPRPQQPRRPLGVSAIVLDPIPGRARDQARRRNQALDARPM
jgi:hypothetical protein